MRFMEDRACSILPVILLLLFTLVASAPSVLDFRERARELRVEWSAYEEFVTAT